MHSLKAFRTLAMAIVALSLTSVVDGHSWEEMSRVIAPNGTFVGPPGYARGNVLRTNPSFNDGAMVNLLPPNGGTAGNKILDTDPICKSTQQQQTQTDGSPRLKVQAGGMVAILYQENGHVTIPDRPLGKAPGSGTVYIYGTSDPKPDDKFNAIYGQWNADGSGGDKRGKLLANQTFDDGQCYQVSGNPVSKDRQAKFKKQNDPLMGGDLWCQTDFAVPKDLPAGKPYAVYWVWNWDTQKGAAGLPDGLIERYTSCMDFDIVAGNNAQDLASASYIDGQPLNNAAVASRFKAMAEAAKGNPQNAPASSPVQQSSTPATTAPASVTAPAAIAVPTPTPMLTTFVVTLTRTMNAGPSPTAAKPSAAASKKARDLSKHKRLVHAHARDVPVIKDTSGDKSSSADIKPINSARPWRA